jgi:uncharacterized membrane protein YsdA (DUF1294 family)
MNKLLLYLLIINIFAFLAFGIDKYQAIQKKTRISEISLFILIIAGGQIGSLMGMFIFHHKTKKIKFYIYIIISLLLFLYIIFGRGVKI